MSWFSTKKEKHDFKEVKHDFKEVNLEGYFEIENIDKLIDGKLYRTNYYEDIFVYYEICICKIDDEIIKFYFIKPQNIFVNKKFKIYFKNELLEAYEIKKENELREELINKLKK